MNSRKCRLKVRALVMELQFHVADILLEHRRTSCHDLARSQLLFLRARLAASCYLCAGMCPATCYPAQRQPLASMQSLNTLSPSPATAGRVDTKDPRMKQALYMCDACRDPWTSDSRDLSCAQPAAAGPTHEAASGKVQPDLRFHGRRFSGRHTTMILSTNTIGPDTKLLDLLANAYTATCALNQREFAESQEPDNPFTATSTDQNTLAASS